MKANELMLGDWVSSRGKKEKVISIYDGFICTDSFVDSHDYLFEPIPLTAEILEKNGFVKVRDFLWEIRSQDTCIKYEWHGKIMVEITNKLTKKDEYGRCNIAAFTIGWLEDMYVHELQHALRLCGIDKEIVL